LLLSLSELIGVAFLAIICYNQDMANENIKDINSIASDTNILLPEGYTQYVKPSTEIDPLAPEATRTEIALGHLSTIHAGGVAQAGTQKPSDSPHATLEYVATDPNGKPVLMRPVGRDGIGKNGKPNLRFEVSTDPILDQYNNVIGYNPRRPVTQRPSTTQYHADPTDASIKIGKHMAHAEDHRDHHLSSARLDWLVIRSYITPKSLGIEDETLPQFNSAGIWVGRDDTNPKLRSFTELDDVEKLRMFLAMSPNAKDEKIASYSLKWIEKSLRKGAKYHDIVLNHGHHRVLYKPWTWAQGHGEHEHVPERELPTLAEARQELQDANNHLQTTAIKPALDFYDEYLKKGKNADEMDSFAETQTGVPALREAIAAAAEVKRLEEIKSLTDEWEASRQALLDAKPSRGERKVLHKLEEAVQARDLAAIRQISSKRHEFAEMIDAVKASQKLVYRIQKARNSRPHLAHAPTHHP